MDVLFWVTPPGYGSDDVRAFQNRHGRAAATAIRVNRIKRVVNLSSIWARWVPAPGRSASCATSRPALEDVAKNVTHLRPGLFFENLLWHVNAIREWARIVLPVDPSRRFPVIAARDIGRIAAARLASRGLDGADRTRAFRAGRFELSRSRGSRQPGPGPNGRVRQVRSGRVSRDDARQRDQRKRRRD